MTLIRSLEITMWWKHALSRLSLGNPRLFMTLTRNMALFITQDHASSDQRHGLSRTFFLEVSSNQALFFKDQNLIGVQFAGSDMLCLANLRMTCALNQPIAIPIAATFPSCIMWGIGSLFTRVPSSLILLHQKFHLAPKQMHWSAFTPAAYVLPEFQLFFLSQLFMVIARKKSFTWTRSGRRRVFPQSNNRIICYSHNPKIYFVLMHWERFIVRFLCSISILFFSLSDEHL